MKKICLLLFITIAVKSNVSANSNQLAGNIKSYVAPIGQDTPKLKMEDYVTVQAAKLLLVIDKKAAPVTADVVMSDGTRVRPDGTLVKPDGKTYTLHEGDKVYGSGITEAPKLE